MKHETTDAGVKHLFKSASIILQIVVYIVHKNAAAAAHTQVVIIVLPERCVRYAGEEILISPF